MTTTPAKASNVRYFKIAAGLAFASLFVGQSAHAASYTWNGTGTAWGTTTDWTPTGTPSSVTADTAAFGGLSANQTVNLNAAQSVNAITVAASETGSTTFLGGGSAQTLTLGTGGITIASGAGAVSFGNGTAGNNVLFSLPVGAQTWTNNSSNALTVNNTVPAFTRASGATLDFAGTGAFNINATSLPNTSAGIIGNWAFFGTGANTKYAVNNSGLIAGFTGTAAADGSGLTDTTGLVNYDLAAGGGTVPATVSANTIRYTGVAGTTTTGATSFTVNGLLNAGSGTWTIGTNAITIGATKELVVNTASADISISGDIKNNGGGASSLTKTGTGTLSLSGSALSYSGGTVIDVGTLLINTSNSLTLSGGFVDNGLLYFENSKSYTLNGGIGGTGSLQFGDPTGGSSGLQTVTLNAAGSFSGGTSIYIDRVYANNNTALGTGTITLNQNNISNKNSALGLGAGVNLANPIVINGGGSTAGGTPVFGVLIYEGTTGSATFSGPITVNAATNRASDFSASTYASTVIADYTGNASNGVLFLTGAINAGGGYTGAITQGGGGTLGGGMLVYSGGGTYSGFTINDPGSNSGYANIARLGATNGLSTSALLTISGGGGSNSGILDLSGYNQSFNGLTGSGNIGSSGSGASTLTLTNTSNQTFSGTIADDIYINGSAFGTGKVALTVNAPGFSETLSSANSYSGPTTVSSGTLSGKGGAASTPTITTTSGSAYATVSSNTGLVVGQQVSGTGIAAGAFITDISGTSITLSKAATATVAGGASTFAAYSTLSPNSAYTLANTSGATLAVTSGTATIGSLAGGGTTGGNVTLGSSTTLVLGNDGTSTSYAGTISGSTGGITKIGSGLQTLTGNNTYGGATTINGGGLEVDGSLASGAGLTIGGASASGTPTLSGTGTVSEAVTIATAGGGAAGTISAGNSASPYGTLTISSAAFQNGSALAVNLNGSTSSYLNITGAATFAGTDNVTFTGSTGATTTTGPGSYVLASIGSGSNLTSSVFTGTAPTYYKLVGTGTQLQLFHQATIGTITATPANASIITGGSTAFGVTVSNTAPGGSLSLSAGATSGTNTTGSITAGSITAAPGATSGSASGLSFNGTTVGAGQSGSFTVTDPNSDNSGQTGTVTVNVLGHSNAALGAPTNNNQSIITGGTFSTVSVSLSDAGTYLSPLDVNTLSNLSGSTGSAVVANNATGTYTVTGLNNTLIGSNNITASLKAGDQQSLSGASALATLSKNVNYNVYGHASGSLSGGTLNIGNVHIGYTSAVTSSNSVTASNASGFLVNLKGSDTTADNIALNSVSGVAAGGSSGSIAATLATGHGVGNLSTQTYTFADDSALSGASSNVGTATVAISGQVYSGTSTWNTNGNGSWGTLTGTDSETFGSNWGVNQGSPGLDPNFTGVDTATFGTVGGSPVAASTVSLNAASPNLNKITFGSASTSYTVAQGSGGGAITLSGLTPAIAVTAGSHIISAPIILGANTLLAVAAGKSLALSAQVSGSSYGLTAATVANGGGGTTVLTSDNTYGGGTIVSAGTLFVNNGGGASYSAPSSSALRPITATNSTGSGTGTGGVTVSNGATLAGSGTIAPTSGGVTISNGGTLASGSSQTAYARVNSGNGSVNGTGTGGGLTINNPSNLSSALTVNGGATLTFDLGSSTAFNGGSGALNFANPNTNSTYVSLAGNTVDQIFSNTSIANTINLIDLTSGFSGGVSLTLRSQNPYLLIQTALGNNGDFANLWTTGGQGQNGFVLGVSDGSISGYTPFNLAAYDVNGNLISSSSNLQNLRLYLYNGDLEVVPEPGTWALMIGGLALLIVIQRRKNQRS